MRKLVPLVALAAALTVMSAGSTLGALVNGPLPAAGFIHTSVIDNSVDIAGSGVTLADLTSLEAYVTDLSALRHPTTAQLSALATYRTRLAAYRARYATGMDFRAHQATNVKTTYSRVPPSAAYESGWHYHNGPVIVTVTLGTLTLIDSSCTSWDVLAGHTYIESPRQVLDAKALPARNPGIETVEWFTTRLYPEGAIDPVPVAAPCTP